MFTLEHNVGLIVPSTRHDVVLTEQEFRSEVESALHFFAGKFGGATSIAGNGAWVYDNGKLGIESNVIIISFASDLTDADIADVLDYANELKNRLSQEAVSVFINGKLILI